MTTEHPEQGKNAKPLLPWLIAAGALLVYLLTLNRWVSFSSLPALAEISGWNWQPNLANPLYFTVTFPIRWLPYAWQPVALNLFSAICGALTLGLLTRSVMLLPHDRTREQRQVEQSEFSLLSVKNAWLAPIVAVLACGLQLTFWQNAIVASNEIFDLLIFAYLIRCLLEFRISQKQCWLTKLALVYGFGVTNNWALIGFFPLFLTAVIWIKGREFFRPQFLIKMFLCGIAGLGLYLLLPAITVMTKITDQTFWQLLRTELVAQKSILFAIPRWLPMLLSLGSLLPILLISIRWPSFQSDLSATGNWITRVMFQSLHFVFFAVCVWMFFDYKFSPLVLEPRLAFLTFYYLGALSVGYFVGYILVVFRKNPNAKSWDRTSPVVNFLNSIMVGLIWVGLVAIPAGLIYRNFPTVRAANSSALKHFGLLMVDKLPAKGAVILSDDPARLQLLEAAYRRAGKPNENILLDTSSLTLRNYHLHLQKRYAQFKDEFPDPSFLSEPIDSPTLIQLLEKLNQKHELYYLHPSFGYYFERFYLRPHGIVYQLQPYAAKALTAPRLTPVEIKENQDFWSKAKPEILSSIPDAKNSYDISLIQAYYSRALDYWGVELQRNDLLAEANEKFTEALELNTNNVAAAINQQYNANLRHGKTTAVSPDKSLEEKFGRYRSIDAAVNYNGPFDEPEINLLLGQVFAQGGNLRQSAELFMRVLHLTPDDWRPRLFLAKTYLDFQQPDKSLDLIAKLRAELPNAINTTNQLDILNTEASAYLAKNDFPAADKIWKSALKQNPKDEALLAQAFQFYTARGFYTNALPLIENQIKLNPKEVNHLINKAFVYFQLQNYALSLTNLNIALEMEPQNDAAHFQKSDTYARLGQYDKAIDEIDEILRYRENDVTALIRKGAALIQAKEFKKAEKPLSRVLDLDPKNTIALLNRAIARLLGDELSDAREDYQVLNKILPGHYSVYYGLGEIAHRTKDKPEAIKNYQLYLKYAPKNTDEYKKIVARLTELEGGK